MTAIETFTTERGSKIEIMPVGLTHIIGYQLCVNNSRHPTYYDSVEAATNAIGTLFEKSEPEIVPKNHNRERWQNGRLEHY